MQFGFRRSRCTTDAISEVLKVAREAISGPIQNRDLCAVVTLDVKNAFNSASWGRIDNALQRSGTPAYFIKVIRSYLKNRSISIRFEPDRPKVNVTFGVPQGSISPTLWNLFYDGILRLQVPSNVKLVAFTDSSQRKTILVKASKLRKQFTDMNDNIIGEKQKQERERQAREADAEAR